ncbi:hypothetical protein TBLA_0B02540 [Henningerozyma blattae CBS 6284]|uniref:Survival protein SurE-like phosphatase/nucleotidase domain-containing protein n=1 Tax=Henningerozyma blattae (strain ATCC 34711 / CBS 6284 / DSM 70876 / NBRC 10599 / NRRL Y-10934 / UCD 77-7) TaxID=1071380 RepID=I2GY94_HENB6|nr:hypothetical protein TBLA_0B02540 [Tetrapisispora blattae CBS 6284]CCH59096.1 hypothetical protein TBLA_0B02540 [Tetrapisispora blattae CBS 6284]
MKVLITNDDGPLNDIFSPYIRPFIQYLKKCHPEWEITVCVPDTQKSWIGKAHLAGRKLSAQFLYSDVNANDNSYRGPYNLPQYSCTDSLLPRESTKPLPKDTIEWVLINGTPASCANIGLYKLCLKKFDLLISGPNVGKNTSAAYITSSGTVGAALESVICSDTKAIAISWAYYNGVQVVDSAVMEIASARSIEVLQYLLSNWDQNYDLYSINIPLTHELNFDTKVKYAPIWENRWTCMYEGPIYNIGKTQDIQDGSKSEAITFNWSPNFDLHENSRHSIKDSEYDMHLIDRKLICVTPIRAVFHSFDKTSEYFDKEIIIPRDDIVLNKKVNGNKQLLSVVSIPKTEYIYNPLLNALKRYLPNVDFQSELSKESIKSTSKIFHYGDYEQLDMARLLSEPNNYYANSYIYRKALIRKHYLADTIKNYIVKHPESILVQSFLESFILDLDYAEFLDDSLDENWELRQELENIESKKWWIVKPSMSDKGQGIRVFKTIEDLQSIFDSFDDEPDENVDENDNENKIIISQLRHFIVQEYLKNPLLLPSMNNKKFHIRCYITCKSDLQVFVYDRMLALFAPTPFKKLDEESYTATNHQDLECHLTNTCLQEGNGKELSVMEFNNLKDISTETKKKYIDQIHEIAHDLFLAAATVNRINFQPLPNAFETYGVDLLVDSDYNVKILEVNAYPDFKQTGDELKGLIDQLFDNTVKFCVLPFFNKSFNVLPDAKSSFTKVLDHTSNSW